MLLPKGPPPPPPQKKNDLNFFKKFRLKRVSIRIRLIPQMNIIMPFFKARALRHMSFPKGAIVIVCNKYFKIK